MTTRPIPLVVLSFNRPQYLQPVLESLAAQTALYDRPIYLFQDNTVSPYTQKRYGREVDVQRCIALFEEIFPRGKVMLSEGNIGVCANYFRAEEFVFNELLADTAYFFEDDMVLSPHYLTMMDRIHALAAASGKVGYFAAYGRHTASMELQEAQGGVMRRLGYHWAFGITRPHWLELRTWLEPYYKLALGVDYPKRPLHEIPAQYRELGFPLKGSTQDHVKKVGTYSLGRVSLNTTACFGRNIGEKGIHMRPDMFKERGFASAVICPAPVDLLFPTPEEIAEIHAYEVEHQWAKVNAALKAKETGEAPPRIRHHRPRRDRD